ncbi:MAG: dimethylargininase [Nakamurella sp.]
MTQSQRALIRRPSPRLADGLTTHIERVQVDTELAEQQWSDYVRSLTEQGWDPVEVPAVDESPDGVFVEDTVVMIGDTAVITRPGADTRKPETAGTEATLTDLGYPIAKLAGGTLDGGDVLKVGRTVYVGRTLRTDAAGIASLRTICAPHGFTVVAVPTSKVLHLKSAVTALPDGTIIGYPPLVDDPAFWPHFRPMPEEAGSHVVDLGDGKLLIASSAPRSAELIADLGYSPIVVDISEFEKLEGCVTCLSVRLRTVPSAS